MVPYLVAPAVSIFLSAVIVLSCFTNLVPYLSYVNLPSASYFSPALAPSPKCDIFRGEWVPDPESPQYTNETCTYIYGNQNCLLYGRPDLEFLKWRWKPHGCELPRFDPRKFLQVVANKTLAFIGDSMARNQYQSLLCLLAKVASPKDIVGNQYQLNKVIYYEEYNFTIYIYWTPFLVRAEKIANNSYNRRLYLDEVDPRWLAAVHRFDYALINAANWFQNAYEHRMAFRTSFRALDEAGFRGTVIMRTLSPFSHWEGGSWNESGDCRRTRPYHPNETTMNNKELTFYTAQLEEYRAAEKAAAARGAKMMLMDPTAAMLMRPDGHPSRYGHWPHEKRRGNDCIHWCLPGPVDAWNDMLLYMLSE